MLRGLDLGFNVPSEQRGITFQPKWHTRIHTLTGQEAKVPTVSPLWFEPRTLGMVGALTTAEPRASVWYHNPQTNHRPPPPTPCVVWALSVCHSMSWFRHSLSRACHPDMGQEESDTSIPQFVFLKSPRHDLIGSLASLLSSFGHYSIIVLLDAFFWSPFGFVSKWIMKYLHNWIGFY